MNFSKYSGYFESTNGSDHIAYYVYKPVSKPRAVVQIVHGMCEYIERYEDFIGFLCSNGILVCGHDHLGHGHSVLTDECLGYFAPERGWQFLAKDVVRLTRMIQEQHPALPYFILGHSMGSLVTRAVLAKYSDLYDGALLLGTLNTKIGTDAGIALTRTLCKLKGGFYRSKFVDELIFGLSNARIENPLNEYAWISRDDEVVAAYEKDPLCNFHFTVRAYSDLLFLLSYVSRKDWAEKVTRLLPIMICSGSDDPVGNYGRGPEAVFNHLNESGHEDVELKIYSGARHEVLNETNRAEVYEDLLEWLDEHIYDVEE
ncbi:MAG: alpha/beta fold hydrolase [Oscillospiraceae bacterium]